MQIFRDGLEGSVRKQVWARCTLDERDLLIHHKSIEDKTQKQGYLNKTVKNADSHILEGRSVPYLSFPTKSSISLQLAMLS